MTQDNQAFKSWVIPELSEEIDESSEENTLFGKPATWYNNQQAQAELQPEEELEEEPLPQPLTLDDIEAIRQSAYEDGFAEGKQAGFSEGFDEGKAEGLTAGQQEGQAQGLQQGLDEGTQQIHEQQQHWLSLIERLHAPLQKLDEHAEYQLVRLATALAEQITRCEVQTCEQIILQALKQAVDALPISEQKLIIKLHPEDLRFVQQAYSEKQCQQRGWDLQAEPALMRGDCQINTLASSVEYTFNSRIEQVLKNFFKANHQQLPAHSDDSDLSNVQPITTSLPDAEQEQPLQAAVNE